VDKHFRRRARAFQVLDGVLYRKVEGSLVRVLIGVDQLYEVMKAVHDEMGHLGLSSVWSWVRSRYWRPRLYAEVKRYIAP
jgi:hypothetical protein